MTDYIGTDFTAAFSSRHCKALTDKDALHIRSHIYPILKAYFAISKEHVLPTPTCGPPSVSALAASLDAMKDVPVDHCDMKCSSIRHNQTRIITYLTQLNSNLFDKEIGWTQRFANLL